MSGAARSCASACCSIECASVRYSTSWSRVVRSPRVLPASVCGRGTPRKAPPTTAGAARRSRIRRTPSSASCRARLGRARGRPPQHEPRAGGSPPPSLAKRGRRRGPRCGRAPAFGRRTALRARRRPRAPARGRRPRRWHACGRGGSPPRRCCSMNSTSLRSITNAHSGGERLVDRRAQARLGREVVLPVEHEHNDSRCGSDVERPVQCGPSRGRRVRTHRSWVETTDAAIDLRPSTSAAGRLSTQPGGGMIPLRRHRSKRRGRQLDTDGTVRQHAAQLG